MRIVSRYINTQIFKAVLFVTTGFLALFAFFDVLSDLSFTSRTANTYGLGNSLAYIVMLLPGHTYELLPIAVLIGAVFVMASLAQSSEFTILRTSGLGPWRALRSLAGRTVYRRHVPDRRLLGPAHRKTGAILQGPLRRQRHQRPYRCLDQRKHQRARPYRQCARTDA